ncbi:MAG: LysR family transcriptional regulator [Acidimicrobiales bacterium]
MPLPPTFPELGALDLFCTVVELGSLSRAAEAHGIAQPSASSRIRSLERQLGLRLLTRSTTGSVPTADGLLVAEWAASVVHAAQSLHGAVDALRSRQGGHLRVAASYTIAEFLLPGWLAGLRGTGTVVELDVMNSAKVLEVVRSGGADVGFVESPGDTKGLRSVDVAEDELCAVVAADHPWARRRAPLAASTLTTTPLVLREAGSGTREALDVALLEAGLGPVVASIELGSTTAIKTAVIGGAGPAVLSRIATEAEVASGRLVAIPIDGLDLHRRLRAVWRSGSSPEGAAEQLISAARRRRSNDRG